MTGLSSMCPHVFEVLGPHVGSGEVVCRPGAAGRLGKGIEQAITLAVPLVDDQVLGYCPCRLRVIASGAEPHVLQMDV